MTALRAMLAALLALSLAAGPAMAQHRHKASADAAPPAAPGPGGVAAGMGDAIQSPGDRLTAALGQIGLTSCAGAVQRAAGFLFEDGQANFTVQPLGPDANRWPTVIVIEGAHPAMGTTRLSTLTVTPGPTCSGFYEQVIYWPKPCAELKKTVFAAFTGEHPLLRNVTVSELNPALQVYLTPAGPGCLSVKKEMFH